MPTTTTTGDIDALLQDLRRDLPRGPRTRDLIAEIRDGLQDAAEAYRSAGLTPAAADTRAIEDFGDVATVARHCRAEISAGSTIRAAIVVAIAYPTMLGCWAVFDLLFQGGAHTDGGHSVGQTFNLIGLLTAGCSVATVLVISRRSRAAGNSRRTLALGFAAMTGLSIGVTYFLAAVSHARPDAVPAEVLARTLVQRVSIGVSLVMLAAAASAVRHALSSTRPHFSNRIH